MTRTRLKRKNLKTLRAGTVRRIGKRRTNKTKTRTFRKRTRTNSRTLRERSRTNSRTHRRRNRKRVKSYKRTKKLKGGGCHLSSVSILKGALSLPGLSFAEKIGADQYYFLKYESKKHEDKYFKINTIGNKHGDKYIISGEFLDNIQQYKIEQYKNPDTFKIMKCGSGKRDGVKSEFTFEKDEQGELLFRKVKSVINTTLLNKKEVSEANPLSNIAREGSTAHSTGPGGPYELISAPASASAVYQTLLKMGGPSNPTLYELLPDAPAGADEPEPTLLQKDGPSNFINIQIDGVEISIPYTNVEKARDDCLDILDNFPKKTLYFIYKKPMEDNYTIYLRGSTDIQKSIEFTRDGLIRHLNSNWENELQFKNAKNILDEDIQKFLEIEENEFKEKYKYLSLAISKIHAKS